VKAVVMTAAGAPDVLQYRDVLDPGLKSDTELRVRLRAAGVNPVDTKLRSKGTYYPDRLPTILGCDGAGVVEATGAGVRRFRPGDAVYFCNGGIGGAPGTYAQYAVIDERFCAPKPASLTFEQAAAVPLVLITAWEALHDRGEIRAGQRTLIHAGAGGVGHIAIQIAKLAGARIATTVGSEEKADLVRQLGAEETVLYRQTSFVDAMRQWTDGSGVDLAFDTVGGRVFSDTFAAVRVYGHLVTLFQPGSEVDWKEARLRNLRISLELMLTPMYQHLVAAQQRQADILARGAHLFDEGKITVKVSHVLPLADAAEAHRLIEGGSMTGKIVLAISD
jgi:NADPH2:quinone reductase